jgi:O-antigen biosynthesis protein
MPEPTVSASLPASGVSIVIPSWNGRVLLERYLPTVVRAASAFESTCGRPAEVIVADDASDDDTCEWLSAHYPRVRLERAAVRAGFAPTANRGVRASRCGLVYLVNNDVALGVAALPPLAAHFGSSPSQSQVFAVASQVYDYDTGRLSGAGQLGEFRRGFIGIHRRYFVEEPSRRESSGSIRPWLTLFATGGSSMFDRRKFLELGGFDESFAPFGWEDVELSLRAWKCGFEVHYEPRSAVWHQFSSTIRPAFSQHFVRMIYERNRLLAHWYLMDSSAEKSAHAVFLALKLLGSLVSGHWELWPAVGKALARWRDVRSRRQALASCEKAALGDVLDRVAGELNCPGAKLLDEHAAPVCGWGG